jgi:hypothetical protein
MLRLIVGLLLLAGLAGCSARGGSPAATGTARPQDVAAIAREWVRCVRANGAQNLPDPQIDSDGRPHFPEGTPQPPDRALRACQPIVDRLPPSARGRRADTAAGRHATAAWLCPLYARARPDRLPRPQGRRGLPARRHQRETGDLRAGSRAKKQPPTPQASATLEACGFNGSLRGRIVMDPG